MSFEIQSSEFVTSVKNLEDLPKENFDEIAFFGRSNVGKSSLINMLAQRKELAYSSSKPGRTSLFNYYLINGNVYFVDLPGYGYAKTSKSTRMFWEEQFHMYFKERDQLACVMLLIDARIPIQKLDEMFIDFFGQNGVPFVICLTKTDQLSSLQLERKTNETKSFFSSTWSEDPQIFLTSSNNKKGRLEILNFLGTFLD